MPVELTLRDYVLLLRRRLWVVVGLAIVTVAIALIWSASQTPLYQSSARILINQSTATDIFDPVTGASNADRVATNEVQLLGSQLVRTEAEARLGYEADADASAEARADVVIVRASDRDPAQAQQIAQTYAESYLDVRREQFISERLDTAQKLLDRIADIDEETAALDPNVDTSRQQRLRNDLADSYDRLVITADLGDNGSARIIDDAEFPLEPYVPRTTRNLALGGVLGLMLGAGSALALESLDRSIKTREVIEGILPGVPSIASIPALSDGESLVTKLRPDSVEAEAFKSLRASLDFVAVDRDIRVIQITSPSASAGKTTVAANLAVVMAATGKTVVVVDGDLRRPRLHTFFGIDQVPGLTSIILGQTSVKEAAKRTALDNGRLFTLASGPVPPGPSELLGSERTRVTFDRLRKMADVVIVDSPPVLPVADALVISKFVDATILVANARRTKRDAVVRAFELLQQADAPVVGTVLNQVSSRGLGGYGYGYGYGYGNDSTGGSKNPLRRSTSAPRHEGTEVLPSEALPQFEAAKRNASRDPGSANGDAAATVAAGMTSKPESGTDLLGGSVWLTNAARTSPNEGHKDQQNGSHDGEPEIVVGDSWDDEFAPKA